MRVLILTILLTGAMYASVMLPAYFTGNQRSGVSATGQPMVTCEYKTGNGQRFWRSFGGTYTCPTSVEYY